jgi:hypothetical protein
MILLIPLLVSAAVCIRRAWSGKFKQAPAKQE